MNDAAGILIFTSAAYLIYCLFQGRGASYLSRRIYLLAVMAVSLFIPFVDWRIESTVFYSLAGWLDRDSGLPGLRPVYFAGVAVSAIVFAVRLMKVFARVGKNTMAVYRVGGIKVVETALPSSFSLFSTVYISGRLSGNEREMVLYHEMSHIRHRHTWEKAFMQSIKILMWYNPFAYLADCRLEELQEYEADMDVIRSGYRMKDYVEIVVGHVLARVPSVATAFHRSLTEERLRRMAFPAGGGKNLASFLLALLCFALVTVEFTWKERKTSPPRVDFAELRCMQDSPARDGATIFTFR